jgi:hypothetical protein
MLEVADTCLPSWLYEMRSRLFHDSFDDIFSGASWVVFVMTPPEVTDQALEAVTFP